MDFCMEYLYLNDEKHVYKAIDLDELLELFDSSFTGLIFIGGHWCKNCQAIINHLNNIVKMCNIKNVYYFDVRVETELGIIEDLRNPTSLDFRLKFTKIIDKIGVNLDELRVPFFIAVKGGSVEAYFSDELLYDGSILHYPDSDIDQTEVFTQKIIRLIEIIS